jgi:hypothetical protein
MLINNAAKLPMPIQRRAGIDRCGLRRGRPS